MTKYYIAVLCAISLAFPSELRTACDVHAGWRYGWRNNESGAHFGQASLRLIVPISDYVGLTAGIIDFGFAGGTILVSTGTFGFIEKMPAEYLSPYLTQILVLDLGASLFPDGYGFVDFAVGLGLGVEFLSKHDLCPFIEGTYTFYTGNIDGHVIGASIGVRVNL